MNEARSPNIDLIDELSAKLISGTEQVKLQAISELTNYGEAGSKQLIGLLLQRRSEQTEISCIDGKAYQSLLQLDNPQVMQILQANFPNGVFAVQSEAGIDYEPLQKLLAAQDFEAADRLTSKKMCEATGIEATKRGWLYYTDVARIPVTDLKTIDNLWLIYSEGKFGFSVQRKIWLGLGKNWEKLWLQIGWKQNGKFTRYPNEFTWSITAPKGHLPLSNQIRGNKAIAAIFSHRLWQ
jgi:hypothetical protein